MPADELVVDASAIGALLFDEPDASKVKRTLGGLALVAPTLLPYEIASICQKKSAARPAMISVYQAALHALPDLPIRFIAVPAASVNQFAELCGLSAYDAAYLTLAIFRGSPLVTLDEKLNKAARKMKVNP